jgi:hypothetical protein
VGRSRKKLDRPGAREGLRCAQEAGPTGYGLQQALAEAGVNCDVIAPSRMPKAPRDRVKTGRRDAIRLAHCLRSGDLTRIYGPDNACGAVRDMLRARHRLSKVLLRHGRRWAKGNWTRGRFEWNAQQEFEHEAQRRVPQESLHTVNECAARIDRDQALLAALVRRRARPSGSPRSRRSAAFSR